MRRGRAIGMMASAIVVLSAISMYVLGEMPANSPDGDEQIMTYLSLVLFVMALALVLPLALAIARKGDSPPAGDLARDEGDDGDWASDIELEFRALEMELDREENGPP